MSTALPRAAAPFVEFPTVLRANGFAAAPDQTMGFVEAVGLLGPRSIDDVRRAAYALFAPPPERRPEFDALFRAFFLGQTVAAPTTGADDEEDVIVQEERPGGVGAVDSDEVNEVGAEAASAEALGRRSFDDLTAAAALRRFERAAPGRLPRRLSARRRTARVGDGWSLRRTLRDAVKRDGEALTLYRTRRRRRQRRILVLLDVSGSMKGQTEGALALAHAVTRAAERAEVFTFGTRLTRITPALRRRQRAQALAAASATVSDWDGGTRIGDALQAFLATPRFAGYARGAYVVVLSDGLERGDPAEMIDAVRALSRRAWALDWLTPLAADPGFRPQTQALAAAAPYLDRIADGSSVAAVCAHLLERASTP